MNILFTFFVPSGGVETLNRQRFYALTSIGINCHFLYLQQGTGLKNTINAPIFITNNDEEIANIIQQGNYDGIVVGSDLLLLEKIRKIGYNGILIYEIQGLGNNKEYANYFLKTHGAPNINQYSDAILYPNTPHLEKAFQTIFPHKLQYHFHNCFNTKEFHYVKYPKLRYPIIGWVGRLEENKNWRDFLEIGAKLMKQNSAVQLWIFEDNTLTAKGERAAFNRKTNELKLKKNLRIFANQPHNKMATYFSKIGDSGGVFCSTSKVEGFGYAVLEAMACGCPVLSTDSDGVKSLITHNKTGKFYEIGNIDQAVQEANDLMKNTKLRETIRLNGVEHIKTTFSLEQYANHFSNMINDLKKQKQGMK